MDMWLAVAMLNILSAVLVVVHRWGDQSAPFPWFTVAAANVSSALAVVFALR